MYFIRYVLSCFYLWVFLMISYILTYVTRISIIEGRFLREKQFAGLTEGGLCDLKRVNYQNCSCYVRMMDNLIYLFFHYIDLV